MYKHVCRLRHVSAPLSSIREFCHDKISVSSLPKYDNRNMKKDETYIGQNGLIEAPCTDTPKYAKISLL